MSYTLIRAKDDTVVILSNKEVDWTDFVDCNTAFVTQMDYLNESE
mgnify:CR=1 FL=1